MPSPVQRTAIRGRFLDFKNCVSQADQISEQVRYIEDGLLICEQGKIQSVSALGKKGRHSVNANTESQRLPRPSALCLASSTPIFIFHRPK